MLGTVSSPRARRIAGNGSPTFSSPRSYLPKTVAEHIGQRQRALTGQVGRRYGPANSVLTQNVLQARNPATAECLGRLIRKRLELMDAGLWRLVRDGTTDTATQAVLAAAVKHSALLGDFLDLIVRDQLRIFAKALTGSGLSPANFADEHLRRS